MLQVKVINGVEIVIKSSKPRMITCKVPIYNLYKFWVFHPSRLIVDGIKYEGMSSPLQAWQAA